MNIPILKFSIEIEVENDAFTGTNREPEIARILVDLASNVYKGKIVNRLKDINGNLVGTSKFINN
jgi:hypothetical protein